jgi:hypothetical protein
MLKRRKNTKFKKATHSFSTGSIVTEPVGKIWTAMLHSMCVCYLYKEEKKRRERKKETWLGARRERERDPGLRSRMASLTR